MSSCNHTTQDPLPGLCQAYWAAYNAFGASRGDQEQDDRLWADYVTALDAVCATQATTRAGLMAQWQVFKNENSEILLEGGAPHVALALENLSKAIEAAE